MAGRRHRLAAFPPSRAAFVLLAVMLARCHAAAAQDDSAVPNFFDAGLSAVDSSGRKVEMSNYAGKALLVVNVASLCGYTDSNYRGLGELWENFHSQGLEILAFPCNQFGEQEPATIPEIQKFLTERYQIPFPLFEKIDVNGARAHPVYRWLKQNTPGASDIRWNFEKFLIDAEGRPVKHYGSSFDADELERDILAALGTANAEL